MLFVVGLFTGTMTGKLKRQNLESAKTAHRTEILLENSQKLRRCKSKADVWSQVAVQSGRLLNLSVLIYPVSEMESWRLLFYFQDREWIVPVWKPALIPRKREWFNG